VVKRISVTPDLQIPVTFLKNIIDLTRKKVLLENMENSFKINQSGGISEKTAASFN